MGKINVCISSSTIHILPYNYLKPVLCVFLSNYKVKPTVNSLHALPFISTAPFQGSYCSILQRREPRFREVGELVQRHTANEWQHQDRSLSKALSEHAERSEGGGVLSPLVEQQPMEAWTCLGSAALPLYMASTASSCPQGFTSD